MIDFYNVFINDPVYLCIAAILAVAVLFSVLKKLFKFAVIFIAIFMLYFGYLYYTGEEIPGSAEGLIEDISKRTEDAVEDILDKSEDILDKADKLIKDQTP